MTAKPKMKQTSDHVPQGYEALSHGAVNKSTAFTPEEREAMGLRGLLPHATFCQTGQMNRALENMRRKESDIEKYIFLSGLQSRNERLYYRTVMDNIEEIMPLIYTPHCWTSL